MKYVVFLVGAILLVGATASAQEEASATTAPEAAAEPTPAQEPPKEEEKKRSPYYKKVKGWLWLEGFAGPSSYDPDQFGSLGGVQNAPRLKGPEYGFAVGTPFGGPFFLGWFYRQANYSQYKLMKTGLDMQGNIRIPYVHIMLRASIGFAQTFGGNPYGLTNDKNGGVSPRVGSACEFQSFAGSRSPRRSTGRTSAWRCKETRRAAHESTLGSAVSSSARPLRSRSNSSACR